MNNTILMSIRPQYVAKILNGEKTIEVRKKFPKDYVGWVYIYCTKGKENLYKDYYVMSGKEGYFLTKCGDVEKLNGRVVARFWCDKVAAIDCNYCFSIPGIAYTTFLDKYYSDADLQKASCLNGNELMWYLGTKKEQVGYAIHITKLKVFDKPKIIDKDRSATGDYFKKPTQY